MKKQLAGSPLETVLEAYATGDESMRAHLRKLMAANDTLPWETGVAPPAATAAGFRQHLLLISLIDQSEDFRDTLLYLRDVYTKALAAGVDVGPVLREVGDLSSDLDTGMGSLKRILLEMSGR